MVARTDVVINETTTRETYLTNTFTLPVAGDYLVNVVMQYSHDSTTVNFQANVEIGAADIPFVRHEPQDSAGAGVAAPTTGGVADNTGTDQRFTGVFEELVVGVSGDLTVALTWDSQTAGVEAAIYRATIGVKRVNNGL